MKTGNIPPSPPPPAHHSQSPRHSLSLEGSEQQHWVIGGSNIFPDPYFLDWCYCSCFDIFGRGCVWQYGLSGDNLRWCALSSGLLGGFSGMLVAALVDWIVMVRLRAPSWLILELRGAAERRRGEFTQLVGSDDYGKMVAGAVVRTGTCIEAAAVLGR